MLKCGQGQRAEGEAIFVLHQFPQHVRILRVPLAKMRHGSIDLPEQVQGMFAIGPLLPWPSLSGVSEQGERHAHRALERRQSNSPLHQFGIRDGLLR